MPISSHSLDMLQQIATQTFNPRNLLPPAGDDTIEAYLAEQNVTPACPRCGNDQLVKHGKTPIGRQRWKCSGCGHTFVETATTPFYRSPASSETWRRFMRCVEQRVPIRRCAAICGISLPTAIRWRRRYLECLAGMLKAAVRAFRDQGLDGDWEKVERAIGEVVRKYVRGKSNLPRKRRRRMVAKQGKQHFH